MTADGMAPAPPRSDEPGRLVADRYRLDSPLGVGGMGTVWRATDELLGRPVAVKEIVFPPGLSEDERDVHRERTRREARAAARLDHPSAVTVYDVVEQDGAPFLVLELVEGRTLSEVVRTDGPLSVQRTAQVGLALLGALKAAHARGIVHRDVKPGNVILGEAGGGEPGRVVLTDFGIAARVGDPSLTSTGLLLGSPAYIAPERARGHAPGPASDLWSLGATLFTAVEGRPPYERGDPVRTVTAVVTGEHEPYAAAGPLEAVLEGLLARDPHERLGATAAKALLDPVARGTAPGSTAAAAPRRAEPVPDQRTTALHFDELPGVDSTLPARPATVGRTGRARGPLVLLMVLLIAAASTGVYVLAGDQVRRVSALATQSRPPSPPQPTVATSPVPAVRALPAGWERYSDPNDGWSIGVPSGYVRSVFNGKVQLKDPATRFTLRVDVVDARGGALANSQQFANAVAGSLKNYAQLRNEAVSADAGAAGNPDVAELAFTYVDKVDLQVLQRTIVPPGGPAYRLYWQTRTKDFGSSLPAFEKLAATFRAAQPKT